MDLDVMAIIDACEQSLKKKTNINTYKWRMCEFEEIEWIMHDAASAILLKGGGRSRSLVELGKVNNVFLPQLNI